MRWDKAGCGESAGKYNHNQTVQNSAKEVLAAIKALHQIKSFADTKIGLWGISRAGWICPLVIQEYPSIAFWISVSGTDDKESMAYLLRTNLEIEGRSSTQIDLLTNEWIQGTKVFLTGGSAGEYLKLTRNLRKDPFYRKYIGIGNGFIIRIAYRYYQKQYLKEKRTIDVKTGLEIYVTNFNELLNKIECPVLAIFGEKDANVDWQSTMDLYKETIGEASNDKLTIKTFPDGNHGIIKCKTGGIAEKHENWQKCDGYYNTIVTWLKGIGYEEK